MPDRSLRPAVLLLSGGLDSATTGAVAREAGFALHALSFRYGQRHAVELEAARRVAAWLGVVRHQVVDIDLRAFGGSALTDAIDVPKDRPAEAMGADVPVTYVPARNTIFLAYALAWAEVLDARDIFIGANALDYSGYPDCRPEFLEAFERMAHLATRAGVEGRGVTIHAPLLRLTKAGIVARGAALGLDFAITLSCYDPSPDGLACGRCDACRLRLKGFREAGREDPAGYQEAVGSETWDVRRGDRACPGTPVSRLTSHLLLFTMTYSVKELFYTLQGEGANAGRAAVFCRFAGCNLWTGREADRHRAVCRFCDTDFVGTNGPGGGRFATPEALAEAVRSAWPDAAGGRPLVVCTGGEPLLQLDAPLVEALHARGFEVAVETNGTQAPPPGLDWICVSPKAGAPLVLRAGDELKLVYPQVEPEAQPERFAGLDFRHFFLQPMDGPDREANTRAAVRYCLAHPRWRLSLQTHKLLGIP